MLLSFSKTKREIPTINNDTLGNYYPISQLIALSFHSLINDPHLPLHQKLNMMNLDHSKEVTLQLDHFYQYQPNVCIMKDPIN